MKANLITRLSAAALIAAMGLSLTACGGSKDASSDAASSDAASSGGQTLKVMISEEPVEGDALSTSLDNWAAETGNTIERIVISNDDMKSKFPSMAKNHDLPDLVATTGLHQLYPDEFVKMDEVLDLSIFNQQALDIVCKSYTYLMTSQARWSSLRPPACSTTRTLLRQQV